MATVRFSAQLKSDIIRNATELFSDQIQQARSSFDGTWGDKIYDKLFSAEDIAKFNNLPSWAMATKEYIDFEGFYGNDDVYQTAAVRTPAWKAGDMRLHFACARPWPNDFDKANTGAKMNWRSLTVDFNDERWDWLKDDFKAYTQRIFQAEARQAAFVDGVKKVIETYVTLAPALKAWQPLWDLIPQEAKDRHLKISERSEKRDVSDLDVDLNSMTAAVTLSKITK